MIHAKSKRASGPEPEHTGKGRSTRRRFLAQATGTVAASGALAREAAAAAVGAAPLSGHAHGVVEQPGPGGAAEPQSALPSIDWSKIHGFNYQPSYGSSGFELWQKFDAATIERELGLGKKYFPGMNGIRLWLSWDSFLRNQKRFAGNFDAALGIAAKSGLTVMPVLFNRWHDAVLDYGGIYIDHFLPRTSWVQAPGMFDAYVDAIVGGHRDDPRILAWDLSNEPFSYSCPPQEIPQIAEAEMGWLRSLYEKSKKLGASAPITVGIHPGVPLERVEPICDILSIHPYYLPGADKGAYEKGLDDQAAFAGKVKKPLLATECCWGSLDDAARVEGVRYTLAQLKKRGIGWLVYVLHHSLIADAHRPEFGPVGGPGNLSFIEADGSLRPGHGVFNEF